MRRGSTSGSTGLRFGSARGSWGQLGPAHASIDGRVATSSQDRPLVSRWRLFVCCRQPRLFGTTAASRPKNANRQSAGRDRRRARPRSFSRIKRIREKRLSLGQTAAGCCEGGRDVGRARTIRSGRGAGRLAGDQGWKLRAADHPHDRGRRAKPSVAKSSVAPRAILCVKSQSVARGSPTQAFRHRQGHGCRWTVPQRELRRCRRL